MAHKLVFIETQDVVETTLALDNFRRFGMHGPTTGHQSYLRDLRTTSPLSHLLHLHFLIFLIFAFSHRCHSISITKHLHAQEHWVGLPSWHVNNTERDSICQLK